jgi:type II restriction enzyme
MDMNFDLTLAAGYTSNSQRSRRLTEGWIASNMYCPRCGNPEIEHFPDNRPVADFYCPVCKNQYELKSMKDRIGEHVTDGAYETMIERITSNTNPDFFFMSYLPEQEKVDGLLVVPKHFFVPGIIEKRNPLAATARRAGWTGCNILLSAIPAQGRILIISHGLPADKNSVVAQLNKAQALETKDLRARGWLFDVLNCVNAIHTAEFSLSEIYSFTEKLASQHPENNNVQAKIRQQLQVLRDKGYVEFLGRGRYRKI